MNDEVNSYEITRIAFIINVYRPLCKLTIQIFLGYTIFSNSPKGALR